MDQDLLLEALIAEGVEYDALLEMDRAKDDNTWAEALDRAVFAHGWQTDVNYEIQARLSENI
jgi:hypothetical protein